MKLFLIFFISVTFSTSCFSQRLYYKSIDTKSYNDSLTNTIDSISDSGMSDFQNNRIKIFEDFIGAEYAELLTQKVKSFERFLSINYPSLPYKEACYAYLKTIQNGGYYEANWTYEGTNRNKIDSLFISSGFQKELHWSPDTVWWEKGTVHVEYRYFEGGDTASIESGEMWSPTFGSNPNVDSILEVAKQMSDFNQYGRYFRALTLIQDSDSTIMDYVGAKKAAGDISPSLLAGGILHRNPDLSDYFIKRIIVIELY